MNVNFSSFKYRNREVMNPFGFCKIISGRKLSLNLEDVSIKTLLEQS